MVRAALASGIVFFVSACGGGSSGGGVISTPPPAPPPPSYTKIVDMTGDRTFQSGGVQYNTSSAGIANGTTQNFGAGVTIAYTAASDSYRLTSPDAATFTFTPAMAQPPAPATPNSQVWVGVSGTQRDQLVLTVPASNGVALSYTILGSWGRIDTTTNNGTFRLAVGGSPTLSADMPRTGSANYTAGTGGTIVQSGAGYNLQGNSTMTFSANFAANSVSTTLTLAGTQFTGGPITSFGTFNGTGTISSSGSGFTGTLTSTGATGLFSGGFFGPQALEMAMAWYLNGPTMSGAGLAAGIKQ
ncbi:transferrin-binding protein-like solute binding protein [Novosphingobium aquae]|uniref:Transferrin-binding protein-like solute binding protein n=1 Tax=Novosphingobium aquae TaxID=3133435 RepID=A0ABU8S6I0_9SPHN